MPPHLELTDYQADTRWRWFFYDEQRKFLADHEVMLDTTDPRYQDFCDTPSLPQPVKERTFLRLHRLWQRAVSGGGCSLAGKTMPQSKFQVYRTARQWFFWADLASPKAK